MWTEEFVYLPGVSNSETCFNLYHSNLTLPVQGFVVPWRSTHESDLPVSRDNSISRNSTTARPQWWCWSRCYRPSPGLWKTWFLCCHLRSSKGHFRPHPVHPESTEYWRTCLIQRPEPSATSVLWRYLSPHNTAQYTRTRWTTSWCSIQTTWLVYWCDYVTTITQWIQVKCNSFTMSHVHGYNTYFMFFLSMLLWRHNTCIPHHIL